MIAETGSVLGIATGIAVAVSMALELRKTYLDNKFRHTYRRFAQMTSEALSPKRERADHRKEPRMPKKKAETSRYDEQLEKAKNYYNIRMTQEMSTIFSEGIFPEDMELLKKLTSGTIDLKNIAMEVSFRLGLIWGKGGRDELMGIGNGWLLFGEKAILTMGASSSEGILDNGNDEERKKLIGIALKFSKYLAYDYADSVYKACRTLTEKSMQLKKGKDKGKRIAVLEEVLNPIECLAMSADFDSTKSQGVSVGVKISKEYADYLDANIEALKKFAKAYEKDFEGKGEFAL